ncbi:hypothetical protein C8R45DRAFT_943278 [Mycena sanguinolenta]|nr:hypothetical protein C8R45DRAFT_943278 [Mycena sanguinolenta]
MPTPILEAYTAKNEPLRTKNSSTHQRNDWTNKTPSYKNEIHEINIRTTMSKIGTKCVHTNPLYKAEKAERSDLERATSSVQPRVCDLKRVASSVVTLSVAALSAATSSQPRDTRADFETRAIFECTATLNAWRLRTHADFERMLTSNARRLQTCADFEHTAPSSRHRANFETRASFETHAIFESHAFEMHAIFETRMPFETRTKIRPESEDDRDVRASNEYSQASEKLRGTSCSANEQANTGIGSRDGKNHKFVVKRTKPRPRSRRKERVSNRRGNLGRDRDLARHAQTSGIHDEARITRAKGESDTSLWQGETFWSFVDKKTRQKRVTSRPGGQAKGRSERANWSRTSDSQWGSEPDGSPVPHGTHSLLNS